jgi:cytochrome c553
MKKIVLSLTVLGAMSLMAADGAALYKKCAGCHGAKGEKKALGKSAVIAGQDVAKTVEQLKGYKAGTLNQHGMGGLMKGQVASYSDDDIKAVAEYIHGLK